MLRHLRSPRSGSVKKVTGMTLTTIRPRSREIRRETQTMSVDMAQAFRQGSHHIFVL
jgi:hypothetical protein